VGCDGESGRAHGVSDDLPLLPHEGNLMHVHMSGGTKDSEGHIHVVQSDDTCRVAGPTGACETMAEVSGRVREGKEEGGKDEVPSMRV
jgi:hypothetical protein